MQARFRVRAAVCAGSAAAMLLGAAALGPAAVAAPATVVDRTGDTLTDAVEEAIAAPAADIVATSADSRPEGITLGFRVAKVADPLVDPNWASDLTTAFWELDTDANDKADYVVDYYRDSETKVLMSDLDRVGPGHPPEECQPTAGYTAEAGYSVVIDPKCLGGATAFSYRVELAYVTDAADDASDIATDLSPDKGWSGPVPVTLPSGAAPIALVPPTQIGVSPDANSGAPNVAEGPAGAPAGPSPTAPKPVTPQQASPRAAASTGSPPSTAQSTSSSSGPAPNLARTGVDDRTMRMAGFALGIALMGIGLLVGNRRSSPVISR